MGWKVVRAIRNSGLSIYDSLEDCPHLLIDDKTLERILDQALRGLDLRYPIRTRAKVVKTEVCEALGYSAPKSFRRTQPRFPGQNFDVYVQKGNNLQIWNEEVSPLRRYVLVRVNERGIVTKTRVVNGVLIASYDRTGTLTRKYQAKSRTPVRESHLVSSSDTPNVRRGLIDSPREDWRSFLPIKCLFDKLATLVGSTITDPGIDQERGRGAALHHAVCKCLGKPTLLEDGQFPDVIDQLLEIKLQTAPTIDLGLVCPDSTEPIAGLPGFRQCDVRYAVFYGALVRRRVQLKHLVVTTGADFFSFFQRFEGKVQNKKLQIPLPADFFR